MIAFTAAAEAGPDVDEALRLSCAVCPNPCCSDDFSDGLKVSALLSVRNISFWHILAVALLRFGIVTLLSKAARGFVLLSPLCQNRSEAKG